MKTKAAVAWKAGAPLTIETVDLEGPRAGEVMVEVKATGICHTDHYTRSGADPEGLFPAILGHEGAGVVMEVGPGVTSLKKGDHVIPLYTPECRQCKFCLSRKTNLCQLIRGTQGKGLMPDATSRFSLDGKPILHYMGTSTFSNYIVVPEIALAKIRNDAPFDKVCYIGCGVTTGVGAVIFTAKVEAGANVVVFGLGGIGLNVIQAARMVGALRVYWQRRAHYREGYDYAERALALPGAATLPARTRGGALLSAGISAFFQARYRDARSALEAAMAAFDAAGGVTALLTELKDPPDLGAPTVTGRPLRDSLRPGLNAAGVGSASSCAVSRSAIQCVSPPGAGSAKSIASWCALNSTRKSSSRTGRPRPSVSVIPAPER